MALQIKQRELKIVSVIAEVRSISKAAVLLGIAQANLSKSLSDFEARIGLKIFERNTHHLELTSFGEQILPHINAVLNDHEQIINFISAYKHDKQGVVTLCGTTGIMSFLARNIIHEIKDVEEIKIRLKTYNPEPEEWVEGGVFPEHCDILVTALRPKDESLVANYIGKYSISAYATEAYLKQHPITHPTELSHHSCILLDAMVIDDANIWHCNSNGSGEISHLKINGNYICDNTKTAVELARNNLGVVFTPGASLIKDVLRGDILPCFTKDDIIWMDLFIVFRKREYQPWRVEYILNSLVNSLSHHIERLEKLRVETFTR